MTFGAMAGAGLMMVATSVPANAFLPTSVDVPLASAPLQTDVQSLKMESSAAGLAVARDSYTATSLREQIFLRYGNRNWAYTNNPNGTIQWPFPIAVPISDGYGFRISPCRGCSSDHHGVDFTPGAGAIIQAIADGTVSAVVASHYGLGNHIIIDHHINGQLVQSVYAHMADGSMRLEVGQQVKVTDEVGQVGSTGQSTGAHLHLEIHVNGVPVDPFEWLKANAN
jgi:murein DD-endopeptidase MepM/ murein hydrolase activator NlpD